MKQISKEACPHSTAVETEAQKDIEGFAQGHPAGTRWSQGFGPLSSYLSMKVQQSDRNKQCHPFCLLYMGLFQWTATAQAPSDLGLSYQSLLTIHAPLAAWPSANPDQQVTHCPAFRSRTSSADTEPLGSP